MRTLAVVAALLLLTLSGCSIGLDDASGPSEAATSSPEPAASQAESATSQESGTAQEPQDATSDGAGGGSNAADQWRQALAAQATQTMNCNGGTLEIDDVAVTVVVTGPCDRLVVSGASIGVVADEVQSLEVDGVDLLILVASASDLTIGGTGVQVYWSEDSSPMVTDIGVNIRYGTAPAFDPEELP
ncbi:MAG: DUF3060 domain-containing protein [Beutenbergiaceae bacterium]